MTLAGEASASHRGGLENRRGVLRGAPATEGEQMQKLSQRQRERKLPMRCMRTEREIGVKDESGVGPRRQC